MDFFALNDALDDEARRTYAWFDGRVARGAVPMLPMSRLRRRLLERGRPADLLALMSSPLEEAEYRLSILTSPTNQLPNKRLEAMRQRDQRVELTLVLLRRGPGPTEAEAVKAAILAGDSSDEMKAMLELPFEALRDMELEE